jgi:hypothetical protein
MNAETQKTLKGQAQQIRNLEEAVIWLANIVRSGKVEGKTPVLLKNSLMKKATHGV